MLTKFIKHLWAAISITATIGGAIATYQLAASTEDYSLTLYKNNEEKLIERNKTIEGLSVTFQGKQIDSLYRSQITLSNTGKKAITQDFIFQALTISTKNNSTIIEAKSEQDGAKVSENKITLQWALLNPGERIKTTIISTGPIEAQLAYRIKEVPNIKYIDELKNPPAPERIKALSIVWLVAALLSIAITLDAISLIRRDSKLQSIFDLPKNTIAGATKLADFLNALFGLYKEYYEATPRLIITPNEFIKKITESVPASEYMSEGDIRLAQNSIITYAGHANLYNIRSVGIFLGPLLFGFCIVRVIAALI